jgi:hypothetical protein
MVDIEVLGVIASIGAVTFDGTGCIASYYQVIDQTSVLVAGLPVDQGSIKFWQQPENKLGLAELIKPAVCEKVTLEHALQGFARHVQGDTWLWAKGPDYDCVALMQCYEACGMKVPWRFRNTRDVRTILALSGVEQVKPANAHHALADAISQAEAVIAAYKKLGLKL